jgi:hypothetical protein
MKRTFRLLMCNRSDPWAEEFTCGARKIDVPLEFRGSSDNATTGQVDAALPIANADQANIQFLGSRCGAPQYRRAPRIPATLSGFFRVRF